MFHGDEQTPEEPLEHRSLDWSCAGPGSRCYSGLPSEKLPNWNCEPRKKMAFQEVFS